MKTIKFTKASLKNAEAPAKGRLEYKIEGIPELILRVSYTGKRTLVVSKYNKKCNPPRPKVVIGDVTDFVDLIQIKESVNEVIRLIRSGINPNDAKREEQKQGISLEEMYKIWHSQYDLEGLHPKQKIAINGRYKKHILPVFGSRVLGTITTDELRSFLGDKLKEKSASTANKIKFELNMLFSYAMDEGHITSNPLTKIKKFKTKARINYLTKEETKSLFGALDELEKKNIIHFWQIQLLKLCFFTSLRKGVVQQLRWSWINMKESFIRVPAEVMKADNPVRLPFNGPVTAILEAIQARRVALKDRYGVKYPDEFVLPQLPANHDIWTTALGMAGLTGFRIHDFRRTRGIRLLESGVDLKTVSELLQHKNIKTTAEIYTLATDEMKKKAVNQVDLGL